MPCKPMVREGVVVGWSCSRASSKICSSCGRSGATQLCDFKLANGKTCDRPLCKRCAVVQKPVWGQVDRVDYCPAHDRAVKKKEG